MPDGPSRPDRPMPEKDRASVARSSTDQTSLNANTRQRSATRHGSPTPDTNADSGWTYKETIDEAISTIRVHGRVGKLGVDLLRGTIEELSRRGHRNIRVTMSTRTTSTPVRVTAWLRSPHGSPWATAG
jgi:hypothetical protein